MNESPRPVIPIERADDLHHLEYADTADLAIFMAGNQFMLMDQLVFEFQKKYPEVQNIFYETLPPGMELQQIIYGGAYFNQTLLTVYPDVYTSVNEKAMETLWKKGHIKKGDYSLYLKNRLALMVPKGNPAGVHSVLDLLKPGIRISQPDHTFEDIGYHIMDMYKDAGGDAAVKTIMETKKAAGETLFTVVHHRETPERMVNNEADAGPVWATECYYAMANGIPVEMIEVGEELDQRDRIRYYICRLTKGGNPKNGEKFMRFMFSETARTLYRSYGFIPEE